VTWHGDGESSDTLELLDEVDGKPHVPGMLVAWDPRSQSARWSVNHEVAFNGGVLATAGNLVFQGDATGRFSAYRADSGKRLWSAATGSAIGAAPVGFLLDGEQRILVPVGAGSAMQFAYPSFHAGRGVVGPSRLLSFSLTGKAAMPTFDYRPPPLPELPEMTAAPEVVETGGRLYAEYWCSGCHGKKAVARVGGTVPDLRYANAETHLQWTGIVIGGARSSRGMPAHEMSAEEAEAIRQYVLSRARMLRDQP
jgi:quinohemoprotein ethanol dehydrogenase